MDHLAGIWAKLQRGDHHLERVEMEVAAFLYSKPWTVAFKPEPQRGRMWYTASFVIKRKPPADWSIRLGEAVHQYRSGLDHLMTELVLLRHPGRRPDKTVNFPICSNPGQFWAPAEIGGHAPAVPVKEGVRAKHFTELERLQPKEPEDMQGSGELSVPMALAIVRRIDDFDKHATVRPGFIAPKSIHYNSLWAIGNYGDILINSPDPDPDFEEIYTPFETLNNGAQLYYARFRFPPTQDSSNMSVPMVIEPDVSFGIPPYPWITLQAVRRSFELVRRIIDRFREITPEFGPPHGAPPDSEPNA